MREQRIDRFFRPTLLTTNPAPEGQDVIPKETDVTGGETSRPSGDNANIEVHGTEVEPRAPEVGKQEPGSAVAQVQGSLSRHVIHILRTLHNVDEEAPVYDGVELEELERQLVTGEKYLVSFPSVCIYDRYGQVLI